MHNIDRTTSEFEFENEFEYEGEGEFEFEGEGEFEFEGEYEGEFEFEGELEGEALELELATELLGVSNEQELEHFLGKLFKKVGKGVSNFAKSGVGKSLLGGLKTIAKKALPIAGGALGNFLVPGLGGAIGSKLGSAASNLFELELEGLSHEDREFEVARRFVRFASDATKKATTAARAGAPPRVAAASALKRAAANHAPGLLRKRRGFGGRGAGRPGAGRMGRMGAGRMGGGAGRGGAGRFAGGPGGSAAAAQGAGSPMDAGAMAGGGYAADGMGSGSSSGTWERQGDAIVVYGA
jgi:uncharacterized protein (DUF697 family)